MTPFVLDLARAKRARDPAELYLSASRLRRGRERDDPNPSIGRGHTGERLLAAGNYDR
jgi:hypothetical protein